MEKPPEKQESKRNRSWENWERKIEMHWRLSWQDLENYKFCGITGWFHVLHLYIGCFFFFGGYNRQDPKHLLTYTESTSFFRKILVLCRKKKTSEACDSGVFVFLGDPEVFSNVFYGTSLENERLETENWKWTSTENPKKVAEVSGNLLFSEKKTSWWNVIPFGPDSMEIPEIPAKSSWLQVPVFASFFQGCVGVIKNSRFLLNGGTFPTFVGWMGIPSKYEQVY